MLSAAFWKNWNLKNIEKLEIIEIIAQSSFIQQQVLFGCSIGDWAEMSGKEFYTEVCGLDIYQRNSIQGHWKSLTYRQSFGRIWAKFGQGKGGGNVGPKLDFNQSLTIPTFENFKIFVMLSAKLITRCTYNA